MNYSEEIADLIIGEMCEGKPLATLCREHGLQRRTIYKWREKRPEFAQRYNAAQQVLADHLFEEMLSIADNITLDPNSKDNRVLVDKAKLQIETRKYLCGRLNPLRYHEQQGIALNVNLNKKLDEMSDQELIELRNRYLALPAPPETYRGAAQMSDELLQAIEQRLAERQRAKSASHTHAQRAAAIESLMRRSRRDANAKARLDKLLKKFLQFAEFMSIPEAVEPKPEVAAADKVAETNGIETVREMTRRQMREASEADMPIPDPPKPEWHDGGYRPGLSVANKLKRFFSKEMPENGSWMGKR